MRYFCRRILKIAVFCIFILSVFFIFLPLSTRGQACLEGAEARLYASIYGFEGEVDISEYDITSRELYDIMVRILKDDPYMFFVSPTVGYEADASGRILRVFPEYIMSEGEYAEAVRLCRGHIRSALNVIEGADGEAEIALRLHDHLCLNYTYDETLESCSMYSFFKSGRGTCQGYTFAYMACLREAGIECSFAASDSISHIWNTVSIGGEWYHVDVTWDDYPEVRGQAEHECFLKSDAEIMRSWHRDWYTRSGTVCGSELYDDAEFESYLFECALEGDVNGDGVVDVLDLLICLRGREMPVDNYCFLPLNADMNCDGAVDGEDIEMLRKKILN